MNCSMCGSSAGCQGCPIGAGFYLPHTLDTLRSGQRATIQRLAAASGSALRKLLALGLLPGVELEVERSWPAMVVRLGNASVALDEALAGAVVVSIDGG
ncbi:MAG TPA: FeoA family protein [Gemmatimonadales bacterium]|nr:FeoA family protein [Gemmatimonadales bacterium]